LDVTLLAPERRALALRPTANLEAYDYYLRGEVYDRRQYVAEDNRLAARMYQRAVELDPRFALAYAALARDRLFLFWLFGETGALPKAEAALDRARQLAPDRPETRLALGYYYYHAKRDYENALKQFAWVREQQPNDADVISAIAFIHRRQGRWAEAMSELTRATELDPLDDGLVFELGLTSGLLLRRYAEGQQAMERAASLAPDIPAYHALRASLWLMQDGEATRAKRVLAQAGSTLDPARILVNTVARQNRVRVRVLGAHYRDALARVTLQAAEGDSAAYYLSKAEFYGALNDLPAARLYFDSARVVLEAKLVARPANSASGQQPVEMSLALAYAGLGRKADAIRLGRESAQLVSVSRDAFSGALVLLDLTEVYVRTGEYAAALDQLEYLLSIPSPISNALLRVDPLYTPLRGNPRFERLVRGKA